MNKVCGFAQFLNKIVTNLVEHSSKGIAVSGDHASRTFSHAYLADKLSNCLIGNATTFSVTNKGTDYVVRIRQADNATSRQFSGQSPNSALNYRSCISPSLKTIRTITGHRPDCFTYAALSNVNAKSRSKRINKPLPAATTNCIINNCFSGVSVPSTVSQHADLAYSICVIVSLARLNEIISHFQQFISLGLGNKIAQSIKGAPTKRCKWANAKQELAHTLIVKSDTVRPITQASLPTDS